MERRAKAGQPPYIPTLKDRKLVSELSGLGLKMPEIASLLGPNAKGISDETMYKYFGDELIAGKSVANSAVARTLFKKAVQDEDLGAAIWLDKTRGRQSAAKEVDVLEIKTAEGVSFNMNMLYKKTDASNT